MDIKIVLRRLCACLLVTGIANRHLIALGILTVSIGALGAPSINLSHLKCLVLLSGANKAPTDPSSATFLKPANSSLHARAQYIGSLGHRLSNEELGGQVQSLLDDSVWWGMGPGIFNRSIDELEGLRKSSSLPQDLRPVDLSTHEAGASPWLNSLFPHIELRTKAYEETFLHMYDQRTGGETKQILSKPAEPLTPEELDYIRQSIEFVFHDSYDEQAEVADINTFLKRSAAVFPTALHHTLYAQRALKRIIEIVHQKGGDTLPDETLNVMTDPKYQEGIRRAALKVIKHVESDQFLNGDFYNDLLSSFHEAGHSEESAMKLTWDVIAMVAKGGPNLVIRLKEYSYVMRLNAVTARGLGILAGSLPILDLKARARGRLYSMPPSVISHGDVGKPYYFWMSAFLARKLALEIGNAQAAASAAYTAAMGYQFLSRSVGRAPENAFTSDVYAAVNITKRFDLVNSAAGARFGVLVASGTTEVLNIDRGFQLALKDAEDLPPLNIEDSQRLFRQNIIAAYWRWLKIFAPVSIFRFFNGID